VRGHFSSGPAAYQEYSFILLHTSADNEVGECRGHCEGAGKSSPGSGVGTSSGCAARSPLVTYRLSPATHPTVSDFGLLCPSLVTHSCVSDFGLRTSDFEPYVHHHQDTKPPRQTLKFRGGLSWCLGVLVVKKESYHRVASGIPVLTRARDCLRRAVHVGLKRIVPPLQGSGVDGGPVDPGRWPGLR